MNKDELKEIILKIIKAYDETSSVDVCAIESEGAYQMHDVGDFYECIHYEFSKCLQKVLEVETMAEAESLISAMKEGVTSDVKRIMPNEEEETENE